MRRRNSAGLAVRWSVLMAGLLVFAGCGNPVEDNEPVANPAEALIGKWVFTNDVGEMSYTFSPDGRFQSRVTNRYQSVTASGTYSVEGERIVLYYEDAEEVPPEELRLLDRRRLQDVDPDNQTIYLYQG